jgi:hypothetical protein
MFGRRARRFDVGVGVVERAGQRGQRHLVDLAIGGQRQLLDHSTAVGTM